MFCLNIPEIFPLADVDMPETRLVFIVPGKGKKVLRMWGFVGTNKILDSLWVRVLGMLLLILCCDFVWTADWYD